MSINGELSDHLDHSDREVLRGAADSLFRLPVASPPDVATIMARGHTHRTRRTRRLAGTAALSVATAAGTTLALALTGALSPAPSPSAPGTGTIRTAAFTLTSNPNGTATLKINPLELLDTAALQRDLTQYGIPAKVTSGTFCSSSPAPSGFSQVVSIDTPWATATPQSGGTVTPPPSGGPPPAITITIDPSAMPAGAALSVGDFLLSSGQQQASLALIDSSAYTCSSTPPGPEGPPGGFQLLYGGPGPAGS
jgi:hypothetical protein